MDESGNSGRAAGMGENGVCGGVRMTRDEIMNMPAGREMDELIGKIIYQDALSFYVLPNYSTDIRAAWDVVEKIKEKTFGVYWKDRPDIEDWCIVLNAVDSYSGAEAVYGETFPLAICRAALLVESNGQR